MLIFEGCSLPINYLLTGFSPKYLFLYPSSKTTDNSAPIQSANGVANHTPLIPNMRGSAIRNTVSRANVRINDRIADTLPFERAVNTADVNMHIPLP